MPDTVKVTNAGELKYITAGMLIAQKAKLFVNNVTVADTHVIADFTAPSWAGYADIDLNAWPAASTDGLGKAKSTHADITFSYSSVTPAVTVYGVVIYNPVDNAVLVVIKYETPETVSGTGSHVVGPTLQLYSAA